MLNSGEGKLWRRVRRLSEEDRPTSSWIAESEEGLLVVKTFCNHEAVLVGTLERLARLRHPNLPEYWPLIHSQNAVHLVRPFYDGVDLRGRSVERRVWRSWAETLLEVLATVHADGLRHGDLKPSNVILTEGRLVLVDPSYDQDCLGTLRYAAPELVGILPGGGTPKSDLYSLGMLLAEIALGTPLHQSDTLNALLKEKIQGFSSRPPAGYSFKEWEWLSRLCRPQPSQRYSDSTAALRDFLELESNPNLVLGTRDYSTELRRPSWCGREKELRALLTAAEEPQVKSVCVSAPAGFGKSALLREFRRRSPTNLEVFELPSDPEGHLKPTEVLASMLHARRMSIDEIAARLNRRAGGVLIFDDLQWASPSTLQLLERLYHGLTNDWTLLLAHRPVEASWPIDRHLELPALSADEAGALCRSMLGPCKRELSDHIARMSQGSPLMIEALLRGLWEGGNLESRDFIWRLKEGYQMQVSLASSLIFAERLRNLDATPRAMLRLGALCGRRFDPGWLRRSITSESLDLVADELIRRSLVFVHPDGTLEFVHDKIREEASSQMGLEEKRESHLTLLDSLEQDYPEEYEQRVYHALKSGCRERAWDPAKLGAERSVRERQWHSAAEFLELAWEDTELSHTERFELGARWAECEGHRGQPRRALEVAGAVRPHARTNTDHVRLDFISLWAFAGGADSDTRRRLLRQTALRIGEPLNVGYGEILGVAAQILLPRFAGRRNQASADQMYHYLFNYMQNAFESGNDWELAYALASGWAHIRAFRSQSASALECLLQVHIEGVLSLSGFHQPALKRLPALLSRLHSLDTEVQGLIHFRTLVVYSSAGLLSESLKAIEIGYELLEPVGFDARTICQFEAIFRLMAGHRAQAISCIQRYELLRSSDSDELNNGAMHVVRSLTGEFLELETVGGCSDPQGKAFQLDRLALGLQYLLRERHRDGIVALRQATLKKGVGPGFYSGLAANWLCTAYRYLIERLPNEAWSLKRQLMKLASYSARQAAKTGRRFPLGLPHALREQALLANLRGDDLASRKLFRRSEMVAKERGMPFEIAWTLYERARVAQVAGWEEADPEITRRTRDFLASFNYFVPGLEQIEQEVQTKPRPAEKDRFQSLLEWGRRIALTTEPDHTMSALQRAAVDLLWTSQVVILDDQLHVVQGDATFSREAALQALSGELTNLDRSTFTKNIVSALYRPIRYQGEIRFLLVATHSEVEQLFGEDSQTLVAHLVAVTEVALQNAASFALERQLELSAEAQAATFHGLFQSSSVAMAVCDSRGILLQSNARFLEDFGHIKRIQQAVLASDRPSLSNLLRDGGTDEMRYLDCSNAMFWSQLTVTPLPGDELLLSLVDLTSRRQSFLDQLEAIEQRLLASELHDSLSAPFVALHMRLQLARTQGDRIDPVLLSQIKEEAAEVRHRLLGVEQLMRRLPTEDNFEKEVRRFLSQRSDLQVELRYGLECPPQGLAAGFLYRIIAEAITNVRRHAHTDCCTVELRQETNALHCKISDRGQGFKGEVTGRRGLSNMRHRVQLLGGKLKIESRLGKGTTVSIRLPKDGQSLYSQSEGGLSESV